MKNITTCVLLLICSLTTNRSISMERNYQAQSCELCIEVVERRSYKDHKLMHFNQLHLSYQCNSCFMLFATFNELTQHISKHNAQAKPFQCAKCNSFFTLKENCLRHLVQQRHSLYPQITSASFSQSQRPFKIKKEDFV